MAMYNWSPLPQVHEVQIFVPFLYKEAALPESTIELLVQTDIPVKVITLDV